MSDIADRIREAVYNGRLAASVTTIAEARAAIRCSLNALPDPDAVGGLVAALEEIQKMSHTDRCDVPHYNSIEVQCTCHIHIVENALANLEKR